MTGGHFNRNEVCVWNWNILNSWFSGRFLLQFHNSIFQLVSQIFIQKKRDEENKNKNCLKTHWKTVSCRSSHNFEHIALERTRYRRTYCGHFRFVAIWNVAGTAATRMYAKCLQLCACLRISFGNHFKNKSNLPYRAILPDRSTDRPPVNQTPNRQKNETNSFSMLL